jgi:hypothetical protein
MSVTKQVGAGDWTLSADATEALTNIFKSTDERYLTREQVCARCKISGMKLHRWRSGYTDKAGYHPPKSGFPKPFNFGTEEHPKPMWRLSELLAWENSRPRMLFCLTIAA